MSTPGLKWRDAGAHSPSSGVEVSSEALREALRAGHLEFGRYDLQLLGLSSRHLPPSP